MLSAVFLALCVHSVASSVLQVQASIAANTYVVSGQSETKKLQDLLPGIITQLGPDNLEDLKKIYAGYAAKEGGMPDLNSVLAQAQQAANAVKGGGGGDDDDDVPDLVDNFEEVSKQDTA